MRHARNAAYQLMNSMENRETGENELGDLSPDGIASATEDSADAQSDASLTEETGETNEPASAETAGDSTDGAVEDSADTKRDTPLEEETAETSEPASAETASDGTDGAVEDSADTKPDAPLQEETGETSEPASAETGSDTPDKAGEDKADTEPDTALEEETSDTNEPAATQEVTDSAEQAAEDKAETKPDTPPEEDEAGAINEPASTREVADSTEKAGENRAETEPDTPLEEETDDVNEPVSAEKVTDSTDSADEDSADTKPDTPLQEETGETSEPASAEKVSDRADSADEDSADIEPNTPLQEETGDKSEPASADKISDSTDKAVEDKNDADNPSEAPVRDKEEQTNSNSEGIDLQRARDMVPPEEYSSYKNIYDMLDNRDKMPVSPDYKEFLADKFRNMDVDTKRSYNECADRLRCKDADYVKLDKEGRPHNAPHYSPNEGGEGGFKFNQKYDLDNPLGNGYDYYHESAHMVDHLGGQEGSEGRLSKGLSDTVKEDLRNTIEQIKQEKHCDDTEAMNELALELGSSPDTSHKVADVFGGAGLNEVPGFYGEEFKGLYGHSNKYWREDPDRVGSEAFAGIVADRACGNKQAIDCARKYMPRTTAVIEDIISARGRL